MSYKCHGKTGGHHHHRRGRCSRFCQNACSLFGSGQDQCFEDCMDCRGKRTEAEETKRPPYGCIWVKSAKVNNNCCNKAEEENKDDCCDCW